MTAADAAENRHLRATAMLFQPDKQRRRARKKEGGKKRKGKGKKERRREGKKRKEKTRENPFE